MKTTLIVLAWWFMTYSAYGAVTQGPFATEQSCNQVREAGFLQTRLYVTWCWWDGRNP